MPRAKNELDADAENGFAALEAKVEEMQVEAAIEAELAVEDAAIAGASALAPAAPQVTGSSFAGAQHGADQPAPTTIFSAMEVWTRSAVQFQAETFASFAGVRGPQDLLSAQLAYGARALEFYMTSVARLSQASPALWASVPGLQPSPSR
ncbi:hypothetical protein [Phenylobacterium sp.]|jgi:hypothetical protein|uniref:hypothetical protein n=1 Tax=Phenylobacterium sp. TaxID=1871053 RepID=UPI002E353E9E|nr:hypothetical protein [Phenylobacterium sp.]HEX2559773.1 hypothetical protein [Phenylobacterium sp.]